MVTPRADVVFLDVRDPVETTRAKLQQDPHNVLPLCDGGLDQVLGFVRSTTVLGRLLVGASVDLPALAEKAHPTSLAWVTVADGRMQTIKTLEPWRDGGGALPRLSRDGRWIAYSAVQGQGSPERAIHVVDAETGAERRIGIVRESSSSPVWSPDGSHVVFVNQQNGGAPRDLLAVDVNAPEAPPVRVEPEFTGAPIAISNAGTLYWMQFDFGWKGLVMQPLGLCDAVSPSGGCNNCSVSSAKAADGTHHGQDRDWEGFRPVSRPTWECCRGRNCRASYFALLFGMVS